MTTQPSIKEIKQSTEPNEKDISVDNSALLELVIERLKARFEKKENAK